VKIARKEGLLSSEQLTVDGTLIEAWSGLLRAARTSL
jgi:hypothetical protein